MKIINIKEKIRKNIYLKRNALPKDEKDLNSKNIFKKLKRTDEFINSKNIMFYVATRNEVQTENMIKKSLSMGKNIFIPIMINDCNNLISSLLIDFDNELEKNNQGILEPKEEFKRIFPPEKLDLIILPGVAFDCKGNRIGRGKGYYDRFLKKVKPSAAKIALAYEIQIVEKIPKDINDISIHKIITENRVITPVW